ncbi:bacteriocin [Paracoccus sp. (in: a-proteobacteria)]
MKELSEQELDQVSGGLFLPWPRPWPLPWQPFPRWPIL